MPTETQFSLPTSIISNGSTTGNAFTFPNNILLPDDAFANSLPGQGVASDITVGNFDWLNGGIPSDAVVTGFEIQLVAKRGAQTIPSIAVTLYAVDNTSGTDVFYPYTAPYTGLTLTNTSHLLGSSTYLFSTAWTGTQAQNFKLQLVSNGDINVDTVLVNVHYYVPVTPTPPVPVTGQCADCNSPIQVQAMSLYLPFLAGQTKFYLKKGVFTYADGTPVQVGDMGTCGGDVDFVFNKNKRKENGQDFAENVKLPYDPNDVNTPTWTVLPSGVTEVDIKTVNNRGLKFVTPYDHDANLMSNHAANSEVIISNSGAFYARFVRRCEVDTTFSPPISVLDEGSEVTPSVHSMDFTGAGVQVVIPNPLLPDDVQIIIPGTGVSTPVVVDTVSNTSGNVQVLTLNLDDLNVQGINRGVLVQISTEQLATAVSVVGNGVENFVQVISATDVANNLRSEQWLLVAPTAGLMDIVITLSQAAYISAGAESYTTVDQGNPTDTVATNTGNSNAPTVTNITTNNGSIVVDSLATSVLPIVYTAGLNQTTNWFETANPVVIQGASSYQLAGTAPDNVVMSWSLTQVTDWVMTSVELNGIPAVTPVVSPLTVEDETGSVSVANTVKIVVPDTHVSMPVATEADITFQNVLETVTQVAHGLTVGEVVQSSGTDGEYQVAQADSAVNAEVAGIVGQVIDVDTFVLVTEGLVVLTAGVPGGAVAGDILYLDDAVAGALTLTAPTAGGTIVHKLGEVIDAGTGKIYFHNYLGLTQDQINPPTNPFFSETYFNMQYDFIYGAGGLTAGDVGYWATNGNPESPLIQELADTQSVSSSVNNWNVFFPDFDDANGGYNFDAGKQAIFQQVIRTSADASAGGGCGFDEHQNATPRFPDLQGTNIVSVGFIRDAAGQWYGRTANGAAFTETAVAVPDSAMVILRCEYDPGNGTPQARFYVDGSIVATVTTTVPSANTEVMGYSFGNDNSATQSAMTLVGAPSFSIEL